MTVAARRSSVSGVTGLRMATMDGPAARWVRMVWEWEGYRSPAPAERILPHGLVEVTWDLSGSMAFHRDGGPRRHADAVIVGPHVSPYIVDTRPMRHLFGVLFEPGAAAALLGCSAAELLGRTESWSDFETAHELRHRLGEASDWGERFAVVADHFATRAAPALPRGAATLLQVWRGDPSVSVSAVAALAGISAPTLVRHARRAFGLAPAQLRRVSRFRRTLERFASRREPSLARLAHESGYADQAHLTREFRDLAGITPSRYQPLLEGHPFNVAAESVHFVQD